MSLVDKPLPQIPVEDEDYIAQPRGVIPSMHSFSADDEESHVYRLGADGDEEFYYEVEQEGQEMYRTIKKPSLTTISERSEHTELSHQGRRQAQQAPVQRASSRLSWATTTDYGQPIGEIVLFLRFYVLNGF